MLSAGAAPTAAATEHGDGVNIVYVNIDRKSSLHTASSSHTAAATEHSGQQYDAASPERLVALHGRVAAAAATEHCAQRCHTASAERRVARDGHAYTYEDFAEWYGHDADHVWSTSILALSSQPEDCTDLVATEHTQEPPLAPAAPVLLRTEDIEQLCQTERSFVPRRSLHQLARSALDAITKASPNSSMDINLEHWFPWRSYVACHEDAQAIIGTGITLARAEFIAGTRDPNRGGQQRLDFLFYRTDSSYCRLHPGPKKRGDAQPVFLSSLAQGLATEQTTIPGHSISLPAIPYTYEYAALVPTVDRMGKHDAYRILQQTPSGTLIDDADFKWWLFICNLGKYTREVFGCGIVAVTLEDKWEQGVQLLVTRSDNTYARLQLLQRSNGHCVTRLL